MLKDKTLGKLLITALSVILLSSLAFFLADRFRGGLEEYRYFLYAVRGVSELSLLLALVVTSLFAVWVGIRLIKKHKFTTTQYKVASNRILGILLLSSMIIIGAFLLVLIVPSFTQRVFAPPPLQLNSAGFGSYYCGLTFQQFFKVAFIFGAGSFLLSLWSAIRLIREKNI